MAWLLSSVTAVAMTSGRCADDGCPILLSLLSKECMLVAHADFMHSLNPFPGYFPSSCFAPNVHVSAGYLYPGVEVR
jgi:hypothetical protein